MLSKSSFNLKFCKYECQWISFFIILFTYVSLKLVAHLALSPIGNLSKKWWKADDLFWSGILTALPRRTILTWWRRNYQSSRKESFSSSKQKTSLNFLVCSSEFKNDQGIKSPCWHCPTAAAGSPALILTVFEKTVDPGNGKKW